MRTAIALLLTLLAIACGVQAILVDVPKGSWADLAYFLGAMFLFCCAVFVFDRS